MIKKIKNNFDYSEENLEHILKKSGLKKGSSVFLTTSLGMFGKVKLNEKYNIYKLFYNKLLKIIGKNGNLFVPTYSYSFGDDSKKKFFDLKKTPAKIGPFPNFMIKQKKVLRSMDPMMSICGIGPRVKNLFKNLPNTTYGKDCLYERLLKIKNLKNLSLGAGPNWLPFNHYLDKLCCSPYRYDKLLSGYIRSQKKKKIFWVFTVHPYQNSALANSTKVVNIAQKKKIIMHLPLGRSRIYISDYKKLFLFSKKLHKKNNWILANGPKSNLIKKEEIKLDKLDSKKISLNKKFPYNLDVSSRNEFDKGTRYIQSFLKKKLKSKIYNYFTGHNALDWIIPERVINFKGTKFKGIGRSLVNEIIINNYKKNFLLIVCYINHPNSILNIYLTLDLINYFKKKKINKHLRVLFLSSEFALSSYIQELNYKNPKNILHIISNNFKLNFYGNNPMSKKNLINSTAQNTFLKTSFKKTDYKESKKSKDYLKKIIKLLDN